MWHYLTIHPQQIQSARYIIEHTEKEKWKAQFEKNITADVDRQDGLVPLGKKIFIILNADFFFSSKEVSKDALLAHLHPSHIILLVLLPRNTLWRIERMIFDMSSPHSESWASFNKLIPLQPFSFHVANKVAGKAAVLAEADITDTFKTIHSADWLFGVTTLQWQCNSLWVVHWPNQN